ncbi:TPA: hypothetical protein N0F65_008811 [Lagenidium giganteum]|uniref:ATP-dependent RNA helicase n=1 Tax=Lagenidium giganteum TaxID=4803 RepID=A0AAV2YX07_9STRA|nr:TPA: hypothetical protein N0F65_008811 [Lagenidium giganteum]
MGVHGLTTYCSATAATTSVEVADLHDVTLAVDLSGLMYHVCDAVVAQVERDGQCAIEWLLLGGNVARVGAWMEEWLQALASRSIQLLVIADPPRSLGIIDTRQEQSEADEVGGGAAALGGLDHRKDMCFQSRAMQKLDRLDQLQRLLFARDPSTGKTRLMVGDTQREEALRAMDKAFPFARMKVRASLAKRGIEVRTAPLEADEDLAELVRSGRAYAVLANDSDFLCMRGVRYIPMTDLHVHTKSTEPARVSARVFSPELLAEALQLEPEQLVDLAIVCKSDLTDVLDDEYALNQRLGFPPARARFLAAPLAAEHIRRNPALLRDPRLLALAKERPGVLEVLAEIYGFYGYLDVFQKAFPCVKRSTASIQGSQLNKCLELIDKYNYPDEAINLMQTGRWVMPIRFDALALTGAGRRTRTLLAKARQLCYYALGIKKVEEVSVHSTTGKAHSNVVEMENSKPLLPLLKFRPIKLVNRVLRDSMFRLLESDENARTFGSTAWGELAKLKKGGMSVRSVVCSLLLLVKADSCAPERERLLPPEVVDTFLLTSIICIAIPDEIRRLPVDCRVDHMDPHLCGIVGAYVQCLHHVWKARIILGEPMNPTSRGVIFFSAEVFAACCKLDRSKASMLTSDQRVRCKQLMESLGVVNPSTVQYVTKLVVKVTARWKILRQLVFAGSECKKATKPMDAATANRSSDAAALSSRESFGSVNKIMKTQPDELEKCGPKTGETVTELKTTAALGQKARKEKKRLEKEKFKKEKKAQKKREKQVKFEAKSKGNIAVGGDIDAVAKQKQVVTTESKAERGVDDDVSASGDNDGTPRQRTTDLRKLIETLPVFQHRHEILSNVQSNQLTVIQGETGCGKSTSVPQFLYDASVTTSLASREDAANVYVTQPRRIAAIELATTVAKMREGNTLGESGVVGETVGYRIGNKQCISSKTRITYVTTGYMVERLIHDPEALSTITHLVLDEVHERSMDVDFLLLLLHLSLHRHANVRLVIMSATMDARVLFKYFSKSLATKLVTKKPLFVGTKLFPVKDIHFEELGLHFPRLQSACAREIAKISSEFTSLVSKRASATSEQATRAISLIHQQQLAIVEAMLQTLMVEEFEGSRCILVFLPGINSIHVHYERISQMIERTHVAHQLKLFVLHSSVELGDQREAFRVFPTKTVKIILSTNIAESSVTIPDVTHVINCGLENQVQLPSDHAHIEVIMSTWCSRASTKQRAGRAGRVMPGTAYHLFPKQFQDSCMLEYSTPEILRKPLDRIILLLKGKLQAFGEPTALLKQALDAPELKHIKGAYELLASFHAVSHSDESMARITKFGEFVCHFPLSLELCRLLVLGVSTTVGAKSSTPVLLHTIVLVAILAVPDLSVVPSWYHAKSAQQFNEDVKHSLKTKLDLDDGLWSEPLSIWRHYWQFMASHTCATRHPPNIAAMCRKNGLSSRRYQSLNHVICELCSRVISLKRRDAQGFGKLLDTRAVEMLSKLEIYASTQRVDTTMLSYAKAVSSDDVHAARFLLVVGFSSNILVASLDKLSTKTGEKEKEKKKEKGKRKEKGQNAAQCTDRVVLTVAAESVRPMAALSGSQRSQLYRQLLLDKTHQVSESSKDSNRVTLVCSETPTAKDDTPRSLLSLASVIERTSFPASLLYYISDRRYPVELGLVLPAASNDSEVIETKIRTHLKPTDELASLSWADPRSGKVLLGSRSLMKLPIRKLDARIHDRRLRAVYTEKLFAGSEQSVICSRCTLLPPNVASYYALVALVTAPRRSNVWVMAQNDETLAFTFVRLDQQTIELPPGKCLTTTALECVNRLRSGLSKALFGDGGIAVEDIALICQDALLEPMAKSGKNTFKLTQLVMDSEIASAAADSQPQEQLPRYLLD